MPQLAVDLGILVAGVLAILGAIVLGFALAEMRFRRRK